VEGLSLGGEKVELGDVWRCKGTAVSSALTPAEPSGAIRHEFEAAAQATQSFKLFVTALLAEEAGVAGRLGGQKAMCGEVQRVVASAVLTVCSSVVAHHKMDGQPRRLGVESAARV